MSRRQGHVRRRGEAWELRWRVNGQVRTETFKGTRKAAEKRLRDLHDLADRGIAPSKDTCDAWFTTWLAATKHELSPVSHAYYTGTVDRIFRPAFGDIKLATLDMFTIRKAWAELAERLAPASVRVAHRILSACLSYAVEGGLIPSNPCANWRKGRGLPKMLNREKPSLNSQQVWHLIEAARDRDDLFAAVLLGLGLGARRGEVCALKWLHIEMSSGVVTIAEALKELSANDIRTGPPKGGKARKVRLPTSYLALLSDWRRLQAERLLALGHRVTPNDYVCMDAAGRPMTPERLTKQFAALAKQCGLSITYHGLRHTHASLLLAGGESVKAVQERLGHSTAAQTLNVYAHSIRDAGDGEAERLDRALSGQRGIGLDKFR
jgi:integrase